MAKKARRAAARPAKAKQSARPPAGKKAACKEAGAKKPAIKQLASTKPATTKPAAKRASAKSTDAAGPAPARPPKKSYTTEENRGGQFFTKIGVWQILHEDRGQTIFSKQILAERFFKDIERDEDPDPEPVDYPLEDDPDADWMADEDEFELPSEDSAAPAIGNTGRLATPYNRIRERHKRKMQRAIEALQKYGVEIIDVDEHGNELTPAALQARRAKNKSAERFWRYNPDGPRAQGFGRLLSHNLIGGSELVVMMALHDVLEGMRGTPHQKALEEVDKELEKMKACLPQTLRDEAEAQSHAYRHSVGNTAKYLPKAELLKRWYQACVHGKQVVIEHAVPGYPPQRRQLAAFSARFRREENAIYLLGSENTKTGWGEIKLWKLDRVNAVEATGLKNTTLADLPRHSQVQPAIGGGGRERLDTERVLEHSASTWLELGTKPVRLEVVVRVPVVVVPGASDAELVKLQKEAYRRAHYWMEWCRETPLHPRQIVREEGGPAGRRVKLIVEKCYIKEMASRLLRMQDCFEVVDPPELASLIRRYAAAIAAAHGG